MSQNATSRPPRTLITGGAGFLGSHLCDRFIAEGHDVICMDNFITGTPENVAHLMGHERFHLIEHDVTNFVYVEGELDYVLHFASPASPIDYLKYPIQTLKVGALGTHKTLGLAKTKGARFLLASTSEVYGDPLIHPQKEDYWGNVNPVGLRGVYDEAKRFAEAITMAYNRYHGVETRIVRLFNTYVPRMRLDDGRAILTFMSHALRRGHHDGVQPVSLRRDSYREDLKYVRPPHASRRRTRAAHVHVAGASRRAAYRVWGWKPDAFVPVCRRPDRGDLSAVDE